MERKRGEMMRNAHPEVTEKETEKETEKVTEITLLSETHRKVYHIIAMLTKIKHGELQEMTGLSRSYLSKVISTLKEQGYIHRIGSDRKGEWQILKPLKTN